MTLYNGIFLKGLGAVLTAGVVGAGSWYLVVKERLEWTQIDKEAYRIEEGGEERTWQWTLSATSDNTSSTATAALKVSLVGTPQKTRTCIIKGTMAKGRAEASSISTEGIREQINGDFKTKTGLPQIKEDSASSNWTIFKENEIYVQNFFNNCIRNRTDEERTSAESTTVTTTINLKLVKRGNKYQFDEEQFKKIYLGVYYNPKTSS